MKNKTTKRKVGRPAIYTPEEARLRRNARTKKRYANSTPEKKLWLIFSGYMSKALNERFSTPEEIESIKEKKRQHSRDYYHAKGKERNHPSTKEKWSHRMNSTLATRHNKLIKNGKILKDSKFDLTPEFILELLNKQNLRCIETGTEFTFGKAKCPDKPSFDRIDNNRGYEKKNLRLVTAQTNISRRDNTLDQHLKRVVQAAEFLKRNDPKKYKMYLSQIVF